MSESSPPPVFRRRVLVWILPLAAGAFLLTLVLLPFHEDLAGGPASGPDGFSRSALGHNALLEVLGRWGYRVLVSRDASGTKVGVGDLLLLAEPQPGKNPVRIDQMIRRARARGARVLLVLPKWRGEPMSDKPEWLGELTLLPEDKVCGILKLAQLKPDEEACIVRAPEGVPLLDPPGGVHLVQAQTLRAGQRPLDPILGTSDRLLIGATRDRGLYVVADPDLINNAGLGKGANAARIRELLDAAVTTGAVVMDETIHGYGRSDSVWARLFEFPLVVFTLHVLGLAVFAIWAGFRRFGRPVPMPTRLARGKEVLMDNTARLLQQGRHSGYTTKRYLEMVLREVSSSWGAPREVRPLAALAQRQGVTVDIIDVARRIRALPDRRASEARALALARAAYQWRTEMTARHGAVPKQKLAAGGRG